MHTPGEHSREIRLADLRAWIDAGRPAAGPRAWKYRARAVRSAPRSPWPYWTTLAITAFVMSFLAATALLQHYQTTGYARPIHIDSVTINGGTNSVAMNTKQAIHILEQSRGDLDRARNMLGGVNASLAEAKTKVRSVLGQGFELDGLTKALHLLESSDEQIKTLVAQFNAARATIGEAIG